MLEQRVEVPPRLVALFALRLRIWRLHSLVLAEASMVGGLHFRHAYSVALVSTNSRGHKGLSGILLLRYIGENDVTVQAVVYRLKRGTSIDQLKMRWTSRQWIVIKSLPGGGEQEPHEDFPSFETGRARAKFNSIQAGLMIGLMPNTKLIVYKGCFEETDVTKKKLVEFGIGDCIIFRGDLVHSGANFDSINYRIHCTLNFKGIKWAHNATESAPYKTFKCRYCAFTGESHSRFCADNPQKPRIIAQYNTRNATEVKYLDCSKSFSQRNSYYKHKSRICKAKPK